MDILFKNKAQLGEGSLWDSDKQVLYWVDIMGKKVFIYDPATGENKEYDTPEHVGTVVHSEKGDLIVALRDSFARLDLETGEITELAIVEEGSGTRFNDGKCGPDGRFYCGTMPYDEGVGNFYSIDAEHNVQQHFGDVRCSNGLVWTKDCTKFYYIDTWLERIDAFDYDLASGTLSNRRIAFETGSERGFPDGCTIDADDNIWVAFWGGSRVSCYNPETGEELETIEVPGATQITSCAFGGPDLTDLYITSAKEGLDDISGVNENAGSLFTQKLPAVAV
ncbi:MAG: SMP-30/gluconolactonase/LRE family protein [Lentisphaeria bacterium]|nr:SMP-30/gluconolactonase/LRE family protein [Lentisphaeria bacterium]